MRLMNKLLVVLGLGASLIGCASSGGGSAPAAAAQPAGAPFVLPEGKAAVHYYRPDGNYTGWGLHAWESFQKADEAGDEWAKKEMADRPLPGVTWFTPIKPVTIDDFGAVYLVPMSEFTNGRVNYIIHKGDKKEQANQDKFFLVKDSKEVYVNSGDPKTYLKKEDALAARKK